MRWEYGCRRKDEDEDLEEVPTSPDWGVSAIEQNARAGSDAPRGEEGEGEPMKPHPFIAARGSVVCGYCRMSEGNGAHIYSLSGMETADADRETIRQLTEAAELTARMREPGRNISDKSGHMERNSPLFFGTGSNPTLF